MTNISDLFPINDTRISNVDITATQAAYLQVTTPGTVQADKCVVVNANKDIAGFNNISCELTNYYSIVPAIPRHEIWASTISSGGSLIFNSGIGDGIKLTDSVLNVSISGTAIDNGTLATHTGKIPTSRASKEYIDNTVSATVATKIPLNIDIPASKSKLDIRASRYTAANSNISISFDSIIVQSINTDETIRLQNYSDTLNLNIIASDANNGRVSAISANAFVYLWAVYNNSTKTTRIVGSKFYYIDLETQPNLAINMSGFKHKAFLGVVWITSISPIITVRNSIQKNKEFRYIMSDTEWSNGTYISAKVGSSPSGWKYIPGTQGIQHSPPYPLISSLTFRLTATYEAEYIGFRTLNEEFLYAGAPIGNILSTVGTIRFNGCQVNRQANEYLYAEGFTATSGEILLTVLGFTLMDVI